MENKLTDGVEHSQLHTRVSILEYQIRDVFTRAVDAYGQPIGGSSRATSELIDTLLTLLADKEERVAFTEFIKSRKLAHTTNA